MGLFITVFGIPSLSSFSFLSLCYFPFCPLQMPAFTLLINFKCGIHCAEDILIKTSLMQITCCSTGGQGGSTRLPLPSSNLKDNEGQIVSIPISYELQNKKLHSCRITRFFFSTLNQFRYGLFFFLSFRTPIYMLNFTPSHTP